MENENGMDDLFPNKSDNNLTKLLSVKSNRKTKPLKLDINL